MHVVDLLWGELLTPRIGFLMDANAFGTLSLLCNQLESSFFLFVNFFLEELILFHTKEIVNGN